MAVDAPGAQVRVYDFRNPVRIGADTHRHLDEKMAALAGPLSEALGARLGTGCEFVLQETLEGASDRLFVTAFDPVFRLEPFTPGGQLYLRILAPLAQAFVDRLLGGAGMLRDIDREPTEIETALLRLVASPLRMAIAEVWAATSAPASAPVYLSAGERHVTGSVEGASGVFSVRLGEATGTLEVFCSHAEIAHLLGLEGATAAAPVQRVLTLEHVEGVTVDMTVQWPPAPIRIRDLAALQVGDIVHLDHRLGDELMVFLGGRAAFRGYPGTVEDAFGVRITRAL